MFDGTETSNLERYYPWIATGSLLILMIGTTVTLCILIKRKGPQSNTAIPLHTTGRPEYSYNIETQSCTCRPE